MNVLVISSNTLPAAPSGPAYVAGALRQAGHAVEVCDSLGVTDLRQLISARLRRFHPEVVGISIRLVHGDVQDPASAFGTRYLDLRPRVKEIVEAVRRSSSARIVLGGPGFNYYAHDWLAYLDLEYGIRGEGEVAFPLFLQALAGGGDPGAVPGCITRRGGQFRCVPPRGVEDLDRQGLPAYDLFDWPDYAGHKVLPALFTKRGCASGCTYCPYGKLEGKRYRLKSPERVLAEVRHTLNHAAGGRIMFCDNNFNVPLRHAEELCRAFRAQAPDFQWGTGDLKPVGIDEGFCRLLKDSGCFYANLSIESASDTVLRRMKRGYTARQVHESLSALRRSGIAFGASLLFGAPGETPDTVAETLAVLQEFEIPLGVWATIGIYLWTDYQDITAEARQEGRLEEGSSLFDGPVYLSAGLPPGCVQELTQALRAKPGYTAQVNHPGKLLSPAPGGPGLT